MLIHQGWFTALYTQHPPQPQSFEFLICILLPANMPLIRCTNVFYKGDYPVTLLPPPRRLAPSLGLGTTWVRQLRSGSCHHPTAATKCNERPSQSHSKPRRWKSMLIHQGWFTALYTQHPPQPQSFEFLICILLPANMPLIRCTNVFYKGDYPVTMIISPSFSFRKN